MKIAFAKYILKPNAPLNSRDHSEVASQVKIRSSNREGALLKFEFKNGFGYADCHPWIEFGDQALREQIQSLKFFSGGGHSPLTPILRRAFHYAQIDANFREKKTNAFAGLTVPNSHFLVVDLAELTSEGVKRALTAGFRTFKIKLGFDFKFEAQKISQIFEQETPELRLRFDCNASGSFDSISDFWASLPRGVKTRVEFIEDPTPYGPEPGPEPKPEQWQKLRNLQRIPLAKDFELAQPADYDFLILKPAVQNAEEQMKNESAVQVVVTTYMDHPLGQCQAAWEAGQLKHRFPGRIRECGLLSHLVYEKNSFSENLNQSGPEWHSPAGTGFGFDELLQRQKWTAV